MHKVLVSIIGAAAALGAAAPAAAQYYPAPPPPAPGYGYGYGHENWQQIRQLRVRINGIRRQIGWLVQRDAIRGRSADRLLDEANRIDRRLGERAWGGFDPRELGEIQYRVQRLEQQVQWARGGAWDRDRDWR